MICCVAGMHRSGTSWVARWLAQSGLPLEIGGSIRPDISNPEGYHEDLDFVRLHAGHIRRVARGSAGWRYGPKGWQQFTPEERQAGQGLVAARSANNRDWGWKDPRTTLFLTEWKAMIPDLKVILVWRPCAEVVSSLVTRGFKQRRLHLMIDLASAVRLWQAYNRLVCAYAARFPNETVVVAAVQLPALGSGVREKINDWSGGRLLMLPLEDVYHAELLHPARGWVQRLCRSMGCGEQETLLEDLTIGTV